MRIALFDHVVSSQSPAGSCDVRVLQALRDEHDFTVFSSELTLPARGTVSHVAVKTVRRPALVSFLFYFARACVSYARLRLRGNRFDLVHATDCAHPAADLYYAHFCHRAFLCDVWPQLRHRISPRSVHSWAGHAVRALIEARLIRRARVIVVPSAGLGRDIERLYPGVSDKVCVIGNTVDLEHFKRPPGFDRKRVREGMECGDEHTVFVFVALGHFERKGLPMLLEALTATELADARLWVVGGEPGLVASYIEAAKRLGVGTQVRFAGRTEDVRPLLWSADAFVAPSHYEAFSLGVLEAAAAGLPLIATQISGSEELVEHGVNGLAVERNTASVRGGLCSFCDLDSGKREAMGRCARDSVELLSPERFAAAWRALYESLANQAQDPGIGMRTGGV